MKNKLFKAAVVACATAMMIPTGITGCANTKQEVEDSTKDKDKDDTKKSAKKKSAEALENGRNALFGLNGEEIDYEKAFQIFTEIEPVVHEDYLAEINYYIGHMYDMGWGVEEDNLTAHTYLYKAYIWGCAKAGYALGNMYYLGEGMSKDIDEAKKYFTNAVEFGCIEANEGLADLAYDEGDYEKEYNLIKEAIEKGTEPDLIAMNKLHLAEMYEDGDYLDKDDAEAIALMKEAADLGYIPAYYELGMKFKGLFDIYTAADYLKIAADYGYTDAMYEYAYLYYTVQPWDKSVAIEYFQKAAEKNHLDSIYYAGIMNQYGENYGLTPDIEIAKEYYKKASDMGYALATNKLGLICDANGDYYSAYDYYVKALKQDPNHNGIKYNVALMIWNGYGSGNLDYAKSLVESAASEGHELSKTLLDIMISYGL